MIGLLLGAVALIAGAVAAVTGFGVGSLLTPTLAVATGTKLAVAAIGIRRRCVGVIDEHDHR